MSGRPAHAFRPSGVTLRRIALLLTGIIVGWTLLSMGGRSTAAADAAAGAWLAEEVRGTVLVRAGGEAPTSWRPLAAATPIAGQSEIATGSDGIAVLHNGADQIRLTPNSRLVLPPDQDEGLMTIIEQSLGKIFFNIGSRPDRSFEVDSPYLVVLVKGTRFAVTATYLGDSVAVTEGTVEVRTNDGADSPGTLIGAGQTASVRAGGSSISVGSGSGSDSGAGSGHGTGDGEPQSNLPQIRKAPPEPPGGGGGEEGEGSGGNDGGGGGNPGGGGGPGAGGGGDPGAGGGGDPGAGGGGDPDPGEGGGPGDGDGGGQGGGHGCGDGHGHGHHH
jgi:FecR protein